MRTGCKMAGRNVATRKFAQLASGRTQRRISDQRQKSGRRNGQRLLWSTNIADLFNSRVGDCDLVDIAPLQLGEEVARLQCEIPMRRRSSVERGSLWRESNGIAHLIQDNSPLRA